MEKTILSVSDFLAITNQTLEYALPTVTIEGEVSSFKTSHGKFVYFDLKDADSKVNCFMTVWQLRVAIEDGMKVIIVGSPKLTKWGSFSITVSSVRPSGEGAIKKSFELLKEKLSKEGLFDEHRKRSLPYPPESIGLISSVQAAGYIDFLKILNARWGGIKISVANVQVQGEAAPNQIMEALRYFNELAETPQVLVLVRGGGSADDLSAFNDEKLARAIASSRVPVLVGVGHEVDETLADLAADLRASTPSNAAELLVPDKQAKLENLRRQMQSLEKIYALKINSHMEQINLKLQNAYRAIVNKIVDYEANLKYKNNLLSALNPETVLERGYAILRGEVKIGNLLEIQTKRNIIKSRIEEIQ